jgi:hypothetical protein
MIDGADRWLLGWGVIGLVGWVCWWLVSWLVVAALGWLVGWLDIVGGTLRTHTAVAESSNTRIGEGT